MNVMPKDGAAAGFDLAAWHKELLALNPWAHELTIDEDNAEFAAARQKATLARHAEGVEVWNGWANGMLALKAALEAAGKSAARREQPWDPLQRENEATQVWLALAAAVFSTESLTHRFENDVSFHQSVLPSDAWFEHGTFSGEARFESATFSDTASFTRATFNGEANFPYATFSDAATFQGATFSDTAVFESATFSDTASFKGATFKGERPISRTPPSVMWLGSKGPPSAARPISGAPPSAIWLCSKGPPSAVWPSS